MCVCWLLPPPAVPTSLPLLGPPSSLSRWDTAMLTSGHLLTDSGAYVSKWKGESHVCSWQRCCEDCWHDKKGLRMSHKLSWQSSGRFQRTGSDSESSPTVCQMLSNSFARYRKTSLMKGRVDPCGKAHRCFILRNSQGRPAFSNHPLTSGWPSTWRQTLYQHQDGDSLLAQTWLVILAIKCFLMKVHT